jgi:riboflavin synthase
VFTGIVEATGEVLSLEERGAHVRLVVGAPALASTVALGDSVAVSGVCLTVAQSHPEQLHFDVVRESLERTSLEALRPGSPVNLERAMRADARLDGHIVQGHVDEAGRVRELRRHDSDVQLQVEASAGFLDLLVEKGSVTVDGVSLTVVSVAEGSFEVALVPHTLEVTTLGAARPGTPLNLEADVLGKYVKRYLERMLPGNPAAAGGV